MDKATRYNFNLNCLNESEKNKLESIITPYGVKIDDVHEATRLAQNIELQFEYILTGSVEENKQYTFDPPFKSDRLVSFVVTGIIFIKCRAISIYCFDKTQFNANDFVKTLSFSLCSCNV